MALDVAELSDTLLTKEARLREILAGYETLAVAYSGGVDSAYLSDVAHEVLGDRATMIHADSPSVPRSEVREATELAEARGWNLTILNTNEFENEDYLVNDGTRCYHCRTELFVHMGAYAEQKKVAILAYGAIVDDLRDPTRLGHKAAQEHRVVSPLQEADLSKAEIRALSRRRDLPTWEKASFACLSSRFPVGTRVSLGEIRKVEGAEEVLKALGFHQYRARHHGDLCRIEVGADELGKLMDGELRQAVFHGVKAAGYTYVALDLQGYTTPGGDAH